MVKDVDDMTLPSVGQPKSKASRNFLNMTSKIPLLIIFEAISLKDV